MFIDKTGKRINPYATIILNNVAYDCSILKFPSAVAELGIQEIAEPAPPADYSEDLYYRTEQDTAPYVVYTPKSAAQRKEIHNARIWAQVHSQEQAALLPRALREFLLSQPDAAQKPWYSKIKQLDDEILALKATLIP